MLESICLHQLLILLEIVLLQLWLFHVEVLDEMIEMMVMEQLRRKKKLMKLGLLNIEKLMHVFLQIMNLHLQWLPLIEQQM
jgi:hypothetical protein